MQHKKVLKTHFFSEKQCSEYIKTILSAVQYMHSKNIVHRDLKCNNIVFDKSGNDGKLKIIDFGQSQYIKNKNDIDDVVVGTLHYLPPGFNLFICFVHTYYI